MILEKAQSPDTIVRCPECGNERHVSFAHCLARGWQECCGGVMPIASTSVDFIKACQDRVESLGENRSRARLHLPLNASMLHGILESLNVLPYCPMALDCRVMSDDPQHCPNFEPCFANLREEHRHLQITQTDCGKATAVHL